RLVCQRIWAEHVPAGCGCSLVCARSDPQRTHRRVKPQAMSPGHFVKRTCEVVAGAAADIENYAVAKDRMRHHRRDGPAYRLVDAGREETFSSLDHRRIVPADRISSR